MRGGMAKCMGDVWGQEARCERSSYQSRARSGRWTGRGWSTGLRNHAWSATATNVERQRSMVLDCLNDMCRGIGTNCTLRHADLAGDPCFDVLVSVHTVLAIYLATTRLICLLEAYEFENPVPMRISVACFCSSRYLQHSQLECQRVTLVASPATPPAVHCHGILSPTNTSPMHVLNTVECWQRRYQRVCPTEPTVSAPELPSLFTCEIYSHAPTW